MKKTNPDNQPMKKTTLTVACISLKSAWQAVCRPFSDQFGRLPTLRSGSLRSALTALLLAPLAALQAQTAIPAKPLAVDQRNASQPTESKPQTGSPNYAADIAKLASRKPSGTPLAPILDPGPEFADAKRLWQGVPSMTISPMGRIWLTWATGGRFEGDREEPT